MIRLRNCFSRRRVIAVLIVLCIGSVSRLSADRLILFPSRNPISAPRARQVTLRRAGKAIDVWVQRSPGATGQPPDAFSLELYGVAGRAERMVDVAASRWGRRPVEVWSLNYPGYGRSDGAASLDAIAPAVLTVFDAMAQRAGGRPIFVGGESLGTSAALYLAAHRPVAGLMLHNAPPLRRLIIVRYGWWNLWVGATYIAMQVPPELSAMKSAPAVHAPALFVVAGQDELVPPDYQLKVFESFEGPKRMVWQDGAGHDSPITGIAAKDVQSGLDWLWKDAGLAAPVSN